MQLGKLVGQTLDGKYRIERELGKGGMGAVFLSTHIGTERTVAVKVIVPEFMERAEFVERFRREARAAGRLRHPNVVDVTDFGIAETGGGRVAYLVMEYLDGCTLGEILIEEEKLPVKWTIDILEQICGAVEEAHAQGIIHRDLKPDNIWLEPNQRGGYTVKVLDFGIAKLEEHIPGQKTEEIAESDSETGKYQNFKRARATVADVSHTETFAADHRVSTEIAEAETVAQNGESKTLLHNGKPVEEFSEQGTVILPFGETADQETTGTKILTEQRDSENLPENSHGSNFEVSDSQVSKELTRFGAILGTPLYMSPEQCGGEHLDARSDIYSLGVIAYQMLSGKTPFDGDFKEVLKAHQEIEPPPLEAKKVPRKLKREIKTALSKKPDERPPTAKVFASKLRSTSEGIGTVFQRAVVLYGEHLPKFLLLALVTAVPLLIINTLSVTAGLLSLIEEYDGILMNSAKGLFSVVSFFAATFYAAILVGTTTWMVGRILDAPVKAVSPRSAFNEARKKWKPLFGTVTVSTILTFVSLAISITFGIVIAVIIWQTIDGLVPLKSVLIVAEFVLCFIPTVFLTTYLMLITPVVMMENLKGRAAFRRSFELTRRSFKTVFVVTMLNYFIPISIALMINVAISSIVKNVADFGNNDKQSSAASSQIIEQPGFKITVGGDKPNIVSGEKNGESEAEKRESKIRETVSQSIFEILWMPISVFFISFTALITALIYFKTRQAGGEQMQELLRQTAFDDTPQSHWEKRIQNRLLHSPRTSHKT